MKKLNLLAFVTFVVILCTSCSSSDDYPDWTFVPKTADSGNSDNPAANFKIGSTVGYADNSSTFYSATSRDYAISANNEGHIRFINHSAVYDADGTLRHDYNFLLVVKNSTSSSEYFVVRPDCIGWGDSHYDKNGWSGEGFDSSTDNWNAWSNNMNGAVVDATISREGENIVVNMVSTCPDGTVYKAKYSGVTHGNSEQNINVCLTVDHCYLEIDIAGMELAFPNPDEPEDNTPLIVPFDVDGTVGNPECTSNFLTEFSPYYQIEDGTTTSWTFFNTTNGEGEWNNWLMAVTTVADRWTDGYSEYVVRRADPNAWRGNEGAVGTWESEGFDGDWIPEFKREMNGAVCTVTIIRNGSTAVINAVNTGRNGKVYKSNLTLNDCGEPGKPVNVFFSVDHSYIQFKKGGYTTTSNK